ncbi:MAG TPA: CARDB domain-containing protein [Halococcus sp.]|nr:CARDB domain-containing protein [Halococcus sp.]
MNRSVLAVLLVGLLVFQGSVTGFVDDSGVLDAAENNTSTDRAVSAQFSEHENDTSTTTQASNSTVTAAANGVNQSDGSQSSPIPTTSAPQATPATAIAGSPPGATSTGTQRSAPAGASSSQSARAVSGAQGASTASPDAEFSVVSVSSDVLVGGTGNVSVTIQNTGEDATNAVVSLTSLSGDLRFGRSGTTSRFVGEWDAGENKTIEVRTQASPTADTTAYPVRATISYEDDSDNPSQSAPLTFGVTPDDEQQFSLSGVDSDLHVGESGTISGTITNEGPKTAADAVVGVAPNGSRAVVPRQSGYVLGSLDPGESESFELPVFVNSTVEPGQRQIPLVVQYYDSSGTPLRSEPLTTQVDIAAEREAFEIVDVDSSVESGEQGTLSVTIENTGENITDAAVSFQSLSAGILFGQSPNATQFVEEWSAGERRTFDFEVTATESATGQTYPMGISLTYEETDGDQAQSGPLRFGVTPDEQQDDFRVLSSSTDVQVGGTGTVSVTLENNGENASAAVVTLQSLSGDITFGRSANATQFVGEWPAGARRTVTFNATASNQTQVRSYPFRVSVSYEDTDGDQRQAEPFTVGVTPLPEQAFDITNASSTLRVGSEGTVSATVTNRGPQNVSNAVVKLRTQDQNTNPQATEAAIGGLPAGESATVSFPVEITDSAEPGQHQFSFIVVYDDQNSNTRRSSTLDVQVGVGPQREAFTVERANASVNAGSSGTVTLNVTNNRGKVVSNINAKAYVDDPLSISNSEAYIARLAPNETRQVAFDVSASDSATSSQYPLSVDFEYETASGESKLSQTYEVPISVTATEGGGIFSSFGLTIGLGVLLVVLGVGWVWSRR